MLILAFDTSGSAGSVALLDGPRVLAERAARSPSRRSAQTLAPAIARAAGRGGHRSRATCGLVATTIGPGSFTGLRVGVTTAKTFAYAVGRECLGVSTLEVIAARRAAELLARASGEIARRPRRPAEGAVRGRFRMPSPRSGLSR